MNPFIEAKNLSCRFSDRTILNDISFTIGKGEYISIIGPNGSGKTTLLRCLTGILSAQTSGSIEIEGRKLSDFKRKDLSKKVSYVSQIIEQTFPFTVKELVCMGRYPYIEPFSKYKAADLECGWLGTARKQDWNRWPPGGLTR